MSIIINILAFVGVFCIVVFVHELGHFLVARFNGVKVEVFAIGFGPELLGYTDKSGTRWKLSAIPLGGYVKMYGDANVASTGPQAELSKEEKDNWNLTLHSKSAGQRAAVASAGPIANFLFAILSFCILFQFSGKPATLPILGQILPNGAAEKYGLQTGDYVLEVDGSSIDSFESLAQHIQLSPDIPLKLKIKRNETIQELSVTPALIERKDIFGNVNKIGQLGIAEGAEKKWTKLGPIDAVTEATKYTWFVSVKTLNMLGQMITGSRSADELGGPIAIFKMSGQAAQIGFSAIISFMAMLSIGLGLINLFPIPALDGGHILFCAIEGIRGKPLSEKIQEYVTIVGVFAVLSLMIFSTWNDLKKLRIIEWVSSLF